MESLKVLIVDDEPGMRMGASRALEDFTVTIKETSQEISFEVLESETAEEALEIINESQPDVLLLDYKLPGMNGIELLEKIADKTDDMPTIMITAYASIETAVTATRCGACDFLPKPFTPEELRSIVGRISSRLILGRQAKLLAEEKKRVRFEFIRVLGHELKAPIGAVEGYINILQDKVSGNDISSYDKVIERSAIRLNQMRKLIEDLLDMTRLESGQKKRELSSLNLYEAAERSMELMEIAAEKRDISMKLVADKNLDINADSGEIDMILNNLVSNAVKYNRDGGSVTVTITRLDDGLEVAVADTGIGMSKEEADKLFGEFVRIKNKKTKGILGSGLGLSITKRLSELYDGGVRVDSKPDVGTTFTVRLNNVFPG